MTPGIITLDRPNTADVGFTGTKRGKLRDGVLESTSRVRDHELGFCGRTGPSTGLCPYCSVRLA